MTEEIKIYDQMIGKVFTKVHIIKESENPTGYPIQKFNSYSKEYYTEKQWGRKANDLPAFIIRRLPVRLTYDNNYFNDDYQGIPVEGYTKMIERMLDGVEVKRLKLREDIEDRKRDLLWMVYYENCVDHS